MGEVPRRQHRHESDSKGIRRGAIQVQGPDAASHLLKDPTPLLIFKMAAALAQADTEHRTDCQAKLSSAGEKALKRMGLLKKARLIDWE